MGMTISNEAHRVYLGSVELPLAPDKITFTAENKNETIDLVSGDAVSWLKKPGLMEIAFEFIIQRDATASTRTDILKDAAYYASYLEGLKADKKAFQFIVTRTNQTLGNTNVKVSLEGYDYKEDGEEDGDITFSVTLKKFGEWHNQEIDTSLSNTLTRKLSSADNEIGFIYRVHCADIGWVGWSHLGEVSGTTGQSRRIEAFQMDADDEAGDNIQYRAHVKDIGWLPWQGLKGIAGTTGQSRRLEAIQIKGTYKGKKLWYQVHIADYGWTGWSSGGLTAGTTGQSIRAEAIQITTTSPFSAQTTPNAPGDSTNYLRKVGKAVYDAASSLYFQQDNKVYLAACKDEITVNRTPNGASRLTASVMRDAAVTIRNGAIVAFILNSVHKVFYGFTFVTKKKENWCEITAYDKLIYMKRNTDSLTYEQITATVLFLRLINDYGLKTAAEPVLADTGYKIASRVEDNVTILDMMCTALDLTHTGNGKSFWIFDDYGVLTLAGDKDMAVTTGMVSDQMVQDFDYQESLEETYTKVKVYSEDSDGNNRKTYSAQNDDLIAEYGAMQFYDKVEEGENGQVKANILLSMKQLMGMTFSVSGAQGDVRVRGGSLVYAVVTAAGIKGWFRVLEVTHHFKAGLHTMDLSLKVTELAAGS